MDYLEKKLASSSNPISIVQNISKLVQMIKDNTVNEKELKLLKDKCCDSNIALSLVASNGIIKLIDDGILDAKSMLTNFITILTTTQCPSHIAFLIHNLLLKDPQLNSLNYKCPYNLRLPQHPFITLLNENPNSWRSIIDEIKYGYNSKINKLELYKPFFIYTICSPNDSNLNQLKQKLWTFLLNFDSEQSTELLIVLLHWMQERKSLQINSDLLVQLTEANIINNKIDIELLILWESSILYKIVENDIDPRNVICSIKEILYNFEDICVTNVILLIISKILTVCCSIYLSDLLKICKAIIVRRKTTKIVLNTVRASLLQWILNCSSLNLEAVELAKQINFIIDNCQNKSTKVYNYSKNYANIISSNSEVYMCIQLCLILERWQSTDDIIRWLDELNSCPQFLIFSIRHFLYGLLLSDNSIIQLKVFDIISNCSNNYKKIKEEIFTLIVYCLANSTCSELQFQLLISLPKMVTNKDNLQRALVTIQALSKGNDALKILGTRLMFDLWKIDNKCYAYLEALLVEPHKGGAKWEVYVTRAYILKELCSAKPELYGKEMVAHLSKILNECSDAEDALPSALAIEGIAVLCRFEIIDASTTWRTLSPVFKSEKRTIAIKSICKLLSEFSSISYIAEHPQLTDEVILKLWEYVDNDEPKIMEAALDALATFKLDEILAHFPEHYLDENQVESGHVWINFLKHSKNYQVASDFFIKMVRREISEYLRHIYQVKGPREPTNYSYLPTTSFVRALGEYLKAQARRWQSGIYRAIYQECLRIFSQEYSKPLPPWDWCFLQELIHDDDVKDYCLQIASHQVIISGTARRFMENYIIAVTENQKMDNAICICKNFKHLANSIQPIIIEPFIKMTVNNAINSFYDGNEETLKQISDNFKDVLMNPNILETNKFVLANILSEEINKIVISSKLFEVLLNVAVVFPQKSIDEISCAKSVDGVTEQWFKKAIKIRCSTALHNEKSPLNWLNEIIETGNSTEMEKDFIMDEFAKVFKKHQNNTDCALWLLELVGQIEALMADKFEIKKLLFLCDTFIWAIIVFSGHFIFDFDDIFDLFPQALTFLLDADHWSICATETLEWLYHMKDEEIIPVKYREMFGLSLQSLKILDEFHKNKKWMKYMN